MVARNPRGKPSFPHVNEYRSKGKVYRYFRRPGHDGIKLPSDCEITSPEFLTAYLEAYSKTEGAVTAIKKRPITGTVNAAITGYYQSPRWQALAAATQRSRRKILERVRELDGTKPIGAMRKRDITERMIDRQTPSMRKHWLSALRGLMAYALDAELITEDPTAGIHQPVYKPHRNADDDDAEEGHKTWPEEWIAMYEARHPVGTMARMALGLALLTAQRRSDVARMGPGMIKAGVMTLRPQKTRKYKVTVQIPVDHRNPELAAILAATPCPGMVFLHYGRNARSYSPDSLDAAFRRWCNQAGLPTEAHMHGLRKAWCRRASEAGLSEKHIMAVTGHRTSTEVTHYTRGADNLLLATQAIAAMSGRK